MKLKFVQIFLYIFFCFNVCVFAQTARTKLYLLDNDETDKPKIFAVCQNHQGLMLCGTSKGLYRFDGFDFLQYEADSNIHAAVTAIFQTSGNRILIGYSNGYVAELKNNIIHLLSFEEGYPKVAIRSIAEDKNGLIWLGTAGEGVYFIRNNRLYNINEDDGLSDNYIYKLLYSPLQGIVAASDRGLNICAFKNGKKYISTYTSRNGLADNIVRSIFLSGNNKLWLGMQDAGVSVFQPSASNHTTSKWNFGQVNDVLINNTNIYVATEDSSLMMFDKSDSDFKNPYVDHSIPKIACLFKDRENNVWAAGDNILMRIGKSALREIYKLPDEYKDQVHCLHYANDSALWFNVQNGLIRLFKDGSLWKNEKYNLPELSNTTATALYQDSMQNLWVGTLGKGIIVFNIPSKTQTKITEPLLTNNNTITITGRNNNIWISGLEGVVHAQLQNNKYAFINFSDTAGIGQKYVYDILNDSKNRIWFATDGEGVSMLDNNQFFHLQNNKNFTGNVVYKIIEDKYGNIWYATFDKGVVKYDGKTFQSFSVTQGLSDINISGLLNAGDDIAVIHKNVIDIIDPKTNNISYVDRSVKILDINSDLNACTADKSGNIYFVSANSVYSYSVNEAAVQQPTVIIDRVELFLKDVQATSHYTFNHYQNNLSFYFTGIYYAEPEHIQYQYKLEGYDKEWVTTKDREKNFPNLSPGTYTFRVRVSLNKNFNNAAEASFSFTINKPFWLQAWFIVCTVILLAALFYLFIRLRDKHINNLNKLKNDKIQSQLETLRNQVNPHFLFNSFNILISEIESNPEDAVEYVERIADFYRNIIQQRDKDIIPLEDELKILDDYAFLQEKRFASGFNIKVNIQANIVAASYVPPLVLQMLAENALKHNIISKETPLQIVIKDVDENCLAITNNINKKMQPEKRSGLGLQNIQRRYALLQTRKISIESDDKFFTVKIPLIRN